MVLFENEFLRVTHDAAQHLVTITRTAVALPEGADPGPSLSRVRVELLRVDRARSVLLVDMRAPALRGDEAVDRMTTAFQDVTRGFRKTAVLVRTAVGLLQVGRTAREGHTGARPFCDEAEALRYLEAP